MMSRIRQELKIMWANVWFRSLCELLVVAAATVILIMVLQTTETGRSVIEETKQILPLTGSSQ